MSDLNWTQRTTWSWNDLETSLVWRHTSSVDIEEPERESVYREFRGIDSYDYLDLYIGYTLYEDRVTLSLGINNLTEEDPPILGNEAGDTSSNSGNTFPSNYNVYGRVWTLGARMTL